MNRYLSSIDSGAEGQIEEYAMNTDEKFLNSAIMSRELEPRQREITYFLNTHDDFEKWGGESNNIFLNPYYQSSSSDTKE